MQVVGYGHLGDGNLHLNISTRKLDKAIEERLEPFVYEWTSERRGSISAEHGLGQMKAECIGCAHACHPCMQVPTWQPDTVGGSAHIAMDGLTRGSA